MMNIFTFQEKGWGKNQQRLSASGCAEFISREDSKACFSLNKLKKKISYFEARGMSWGK